MAGYSGKPSVESSKRRFPLQRATTLVLSLLLIASTGFLIYYSLEGQQACRRNYGLESLDIEAEITVKSDSEERKETISYSQTSHVAYYRGPDGRFEVDDFSKGIHIIRAPGNKVCYLIPVGTDLTQTHSFESFLQESNGHKVRVNRTVNTNYKVLPGEIRDTSFIPSEARSECTNGYKWLIATPTDSVAGTQPVRKKRQLIPSELGCRYCFVFLVQEEDKLVLYEQCFYVIGFEFCHTLYRQGERPDWVEELVNNATTTSYSLELS